MHKDPTDKLNLWCSSYHLRTLHLRTPRWTQMAFRWGESCQLAAHFDTPVCSGLWALPYRQLHSCGPQPSARRLAHPGRQQACVTSWGLRELCHKKRQLWEMFAGFCLDPEPHCITCTCSCTVPSMHDFGAGQTIPIHHIIPECSQSDGP